SGNNASRVLSVFAPASASIAGLTLAGGSADGSYYPGGGGLYNQGTLTLTGCALTGNHADAANGGAAFNEGTLTLAGCTLSGNHANTGYGGAVYNYFDSTLTVTGCALSGNYADGSGVGGALYNLGALAVTGCTLSGNHADGGWGG